jgi:thiosulfate/3-mercaptopyruvate sulfurtransferase
VLVIGYDEGTGWAARLWWLLRHFGHDDAAVIPLDAWHGPLRSDREQIEPAEFVPHARTDDVALADELLGRLNDPKLTLLDARAPERWRGEVEPIDPVAGRIPGAKNRFFLDPSPLPQELLEPEELVVYCGSGVTACAVLHELFLAGREDARLYPGSFSEWYSLGPIERG